VPAFSLLQFCFFGEAFAFSSFFFHGPETVSCQSFYTLSVPCGVAWLWKLGHPENWRDGQAIRAKRKSRRNASE
jgi:hypothetical protein